MEISNAVVEGSEFCSPSPGGEGRGEGERASHWSGARGAISPAAKRNRLCQILSLAVCALFVTGMTWFAQAANPVSLGGTWRFALDRADAGIQERWFERALTQKIQLPGALQNQGFGDDITVDTKWTGEVGTDRWKQRPEYARYRQPGNIKVPFFLQPEKHYVGAAWYQRDIEIPKDWQGKRVVLTLERPHWGTHLWLDSRLVGTNLSLSTPHVYDLGTGIAPGKHTLTLRVDNRVLVEVGDWSHSVSDHTQGNWNGVVGKIELHATGPVWIDDVQVYPNWAERKLRVKVLSRNPAGGLIEGKLSLFPEHVSGTALPGALPVSSNYKTSLTNLADELEVPLGTAAQGWDEFTPQLYRLRAELRSGANGAEFCDEKTVVFGLRQIATTPAKQFIINGRPTFFRGTLECCIFPKTGYPPTDVDSWKRIIRACQEHGLNHIRFHSWCPPEAAFVAADELGFYYQVECGVWTQPGNGKAIDQWLYDESERIVRAYGNHPSFMLLTHGNEPHGSKREEYLAKWVNHWKRDGRFLVTSGSAYPQLPENQYHVHHTGRGPGGWLGRDYRKQYDQYNVPIIIHEMGQWCVYPNFDEMKKYTGPLKPKNFEIFRDSLAEHGMLDQWKDFLHASGRLQALCYKEECEAAMRTPGVGGVQLLDLHDFPGQGTALVGVLDPFWEGKGYIKPAEFRRFYDTTVPLARLLKRTWTTDETLAADVEVSHYGPAPLENAAASWKLVDGAGKAVAHGVFPVKSIPLGGGTPLGRVEVPLTTLPVPSAFKLVVTVERSLQTASTDKRIRGIKATPQSRFENDWNLWVYPAPSPAAPPAGVLVTAKLDDAALARLRAGSRVLLAGSKLSSVHPRLGFESIFWNRYMFNTQGRQNLGLLVQSKHPALAQFPTDSWQDWQWNDIVSQARGVILDELAPGLRPIVQPIDDWNSNRRLGLIWECRVGSGSLLVCAADLETKLETRPAARQLRSSLLAYAAGDRFKPRVPVGPDDLARVLHRASKSTMVNLGAKVLKADSEDRENGNTADKAIDGDPETIWHTRWQPRNDPMPHSLVIDLGREVTLRGVRYLPRQDQANGRIAEAEIYCATHPETWGVPAATARWRNSEQVQTVEFAQPLRARYLKLAVKSEVNRGPFASVAELDVVMDEK